jgi:hypothetical protein
MSSNNTNIEVSSDGEMRWGFSAPAWAALPMAARDEIERHAIYEIHLNLHEVGESLARKREVSEADRITFMDDQWKRKHAWDAMYANRPEGDKDTAPPYRISAKCWEIINAHRDEQDLPWLRAREFEDEDLFEREFLCRHVAASSSGDQSSGHDPRSNKDMQVANCGGEENPAFLPGASPLLTPRALPRAQIGMRMRSNCLMRSAIFAVFEKGKRRELGKDGIPEKINAWRGVKITGVGPQLDQLDGCTWDTVIAYAQIVSDPFAQPLQISTRAFLRSMPRSNGRPNREGVKASLQRLAQLKLTIEAHNLEFIGSLVHRFSIDERTGNLLVTLHPQLLCLFGPDLWTQQPSSYAAALKSKPLALWLCRFYSTHADPDPMRIDNILKWSGSRSGSVESFRQTLKTALLYCETATRGGHCDIVSHACIGDLLHVTRNPSAAQRGHLARRRATGSVKTAPGSREEL